MGQQTRTQHPCLTYHLLAEGRPPAPAKCREEPALLFWAPAGGGIIAEAGGIWAGGALLSRGRGRGRREEEPDGGGPWPPVPLEAPGPAKVKQASAPLLLEWREWRLRGAWPQGPQSPGVAGQGRGGLVTKSWGDTSVRCRGRSGPRVVLALGQSWLSGTSSYPVSSSLSCRSITLSTYSQGMVSSPSLSQPSSSLFPPRHPSPHLLSASPSDPVPSGEMPGSVCRTVTEHTLQAWYH